MAKRKSKSLGIIIIAFLILIVLQFIPSGDHTNPPVTGSPQWDSPRTEQLARGACFDCHSNETKWPWYASIAPISWRVGEHVEDGRRHLNFSEFDKIQRRAPEAADELEAGEMPPWDYALMHSEARLSDEDKQALIDGFRATFGEAHRTDHD